MAGVQTLGVDHLRRRGVGRWCVVLRRLALPLAPSCACPPHTSTSSPALARALLERSASPLALPRARSAPTMATPTTFPAMSACYRLHNLIGRATHRVSENRTLTKISQDSGQWLNSFMILCVTESDNQFPTENRYPRIERQ
eukprot:COSAG01_NODE_6976_length_3409_cov_1.806647_2_plen_142_part_00